MAIDKSKWDTNVKVSQKTIDEIKKMGMAKALKTVAGASAASKNDASAKAWVEGVKRLYGANRVAEAAKTPAKKPATRSGVSSMDAAYAASKPKAASVKPKATPQTPTRTYGGVIGNPAASAKPKPKATPQPAKPNKSAITASDAAAIAKAKADWYAGKRSATTSTKKAPSKPKAKVTSLAPTRQY